MSAKYDIAAYYWPAYHDEPLWRRFMPEGQGEWETIRKAVPRFPGHNQPRVPLWGYEDEADPSVMAKKIDAASQHGVNVFIFDWYWYNNQPFLEEALRRGFMGAANNDQMRFYLMWANHDASTLWDIERSLKYEVIWPGAVDRATFDQATDRVVNEFFGHPSYYKIDGKPVFSIYELGTLIDGLGGLEATRDALDAFRAKVRARGLPGVHLQAVLWAAVPGSPSQDDTLRFLSFDSLTNYQWCHYVPAHCDYSTWGDHAVAAWDGWASEFSVPFYPHVSVGWDTNPRYKSFDENIVTGGTPELFGRYLCRAMEHVDSHALSPRLITVNAWNEWSEGSYLEPDTVNGMGYLEAVRDVIDKAGD